MTLPHFAAERRAAAPCCDAIAAVRPPLWMNILLAAQHDAQTRRTPLLRSSDGIDGRRDS